MLTSTSEKIVKVRVIPQRIPIHVPFTISRESLSLAELLVIELQDSSGRTGLGEAAPFPSLTFDTMDRAEEIAKLLVADLVGLTVDQALEHLRTKKPEVERRSITGIVGVECALYDLLAQQHEIPLAKLFGPKEALSLETDITLPIMEPSAIPSFLALYASYGFRTIKVKVSGHMTQDLAMIDTLRGKLAPETAYILDGNQGFTSENSKRLVGACLERQMKLEFFEQPLPEKDHNGLLLLHKELPIPVCVDETVRKLEDLETLLDMGMNPYVNIKIMKSGVEESLRIIERAKQTACTLMIGGMLESEIAMGFSLQLACGTQAFHFADLDTPFFFKERITETSPWHAARAELVRPQAHGLGQRFLPYPS